jgi:hypothetical protein
MTDHHFRCGRPCNRRVKVIRLDTARHPALTLTLHRRPQRRNTYAAGSPSYEVIWPHCSLVGDHFAQCGGGEPSVNRARTFSYESEIPAATNINANLLANVIGVEPSPVFTPDKAIRIPRRTRPRTLLPSAPAGMKNYRECDYFCRQTYKLLIFQVSIGNPSFFAVGSCHN